MSKMKNLIYHAAALIILAGPPLYAQADKPYDAKAFENKMKALTPIATERDTVKLKAEIAKMKADPKFGKDAAYSFALIEAGLNAKGKPSAIKFPAAPKGITPEENERAFFSAAKVFMTLGDYETAQIFGRVTQKPVPVYVCDVVEKAPSDVGEWLASSVYKNRRQKSLGI